MKFEIREKEYEGNKFLALYLLIDKDEYYIGTLKGKEFKYLQTVQKKIYNK